MHMRKLFQRRRLYTLFIFIGCASTLFLFFQMFTFKVLDRHSDVDSKLAKREKKLQQSEMKHPAKKAENILPKDKGWDNKNEEDCVQGDCGKSRESLRANYAAKKKSKSKQDKFDWEELIDDGGIEDVHAPNLLPQIDSKLVPKGVLPRVAHLYQPNNKNMFVCVHSKEEIPIERFNDDYCDCSDFSDEPQTGACPNSRFYCTFQLESEPPQWVPSSRVDDGICDCCDGSDEEKHVQLPDHVQLNDQGQHLGVWQSPCIDRCQEVKVKQQELMDIRKRGNALKYQYLEAARGKDNPQQLYGPQGVFYKLSQACVTGKSDKYEYTVCLFKEVKQQDFPRASVNIGKSPQWISRGGKEGYILEMSGGSRMGCPGGQGRKSIITLVCGIIDEVTSVQESEVCEYSITMMTPAAC